MAQGSDLFFLDPKSVELMFCVSEGNCLGERIIEWKIVNTLYWAQLVLGLFYRHVSQGATSHRLTLGSSFALRGAPSCLYASHSATDPKVPGYMVLLF